MVKNKNKNKTKNELGIYVADMARTKTRLISKSTSILRTSWGML